MIPDLVGFGINRVVIRVQARARVAATTTM